MHAYIKASHLYVTFISELIFFPVKFVFAVGPTSTSSFLSSCLLSHFFFALFINPVLPQAASISFKYHFLTTLDVLAPEIFITHSLPSYWLYIQQLWQTIPKDHDEYIFLVQTWELFLSHFHQLYCNNFLPLLVKLKQYIIVTYKVHKGPTVVLLADALVKHNDEEKLTYIDFESINCECNHKSIQL